MTDAPETLSEVQSESAGGPVGRTRAEPLRLLPLVFVLDAVEVVTMVPGSIRHRVSVL
jgi:hypothetical protein